MADAVARTGSGPGWGPRVINFYHGVVAELRKVVWPTRQQLITYFWVVLVFVIVVMTFVALLDLGFGKAAFALFA